MLVEFQPPSLCIQARERLNEIESDGWQVSELLLCDEVCRESMQAFDHVTWLHLTNARHH